MQTGSHKSWIPSKQESVEWAVSPVRAPAHIRAKPDIFLCCQHSNSTIGTYVWFLLIKGEIKMFKKYGSVPKHIKLYISLIIHSDYSTNKCGLATM